MTSRPGRLFRKYSQSLYAIDSFDDGIQILSSSAPVSNEIDLPPIRYSFQKQPFIIGVAGGTASGKSTVCTKIIDRLGPIDPTSKYLTHEKRVVRISQDSFYRKLTDKDRKMVQKKIFNFDHPSAFDVERMSKTIRDISHGKMVRVPVYNYAINEISDDEEVIYPADVVLFEGLLLFYFPEIRNYFHMKIFVDTDPDTRLSRRVLRDVQELNRDLDSVLSQYINFVKPSFEEFCLPTKRYADIVVPRGPENEVAVDLITTQIRSVYDPSIRHQSIKYPNIKLSTNYDYYTILQSIQSPNFKCKHHRKKRKKIIKRKNTDFYEPLMIGSDGEEIVYHVNVNNNRYNDNAVSVNGVNNDNNFNDDNIVNDDNIDQSEDDKKESSEKITVPRSKPIQIKNKNGKYRNDYDDEIIDYKKNIKFEMNNEENDETEHVINDLIDNFDSLSSTVPTKLNGTNGSLPMGNGKLAFEKKVQHVSSGNNKTSTMTNCC